PAVLNTRPPWALAMPSMTPRSAITSAVVFASSASVRAEYPATSSATIVASLRDPVLWLIRAVPPLLTLSRFAANDQGGGRAPPTLHRYRAATSTRKKYPLQPSPRLIRPRGIADASGTGGSLLARPSCRRQDSQLALGSVLSAAGI